MTYIEQINSGFEYTQSRIKGTNPSSAQTHFNGMVRFAKKDNIDINEYLAEKNTSLAAIHLGIAAGYYKNSLPTAKQHGVKSFELMAERVEQHLDSAVDELQIKGRNQHEKRALAILQEIETPHIFTLYKENRSFRAHLKVLFRTEMLRNNLNEDEINHLDFDGAFKYGEKNYENTLG